MRERIRDHGVRRGPLLPLQSGLQPGVRRTEERGPRIVTYFLRSHLLRFRLLPVFSQIKTTRENTDGCGRQTEYRDKKRAFRCHYWSSTLPPARFASADQAAPVRQPARRQGAANASSRRCPSSARCFSTTAVRGPRHGFCFFLQRDLLISVQALPPPAPPQRVIQGESSLTSSSPAARVKSTLHYSSFLPLKPALLADSPFGAGSRCKPLPFDIFLPQEGQL